MAYDASLKEKWDNYSTMKYAIMDGEKKGLEEGRQEQKIEIARAMKERIGIFSNF